MQFILTVVFACGVGCDEPSNVQVNPPYPTREECDTAGKAWLSPVANPTITYTCTSTSQQVMDGRGNR